MRALFIAVLVPLAIGACSPVGPVVAEDSMVVIGESAPALPNIDRTRHWDGQNLVEEWDWKSGQLYIVRLERSRYYSTSFDDPAELIEDVETWPVLRRDGTQFNVREVQSSRNSIGDFLYAVSDMNSNRKHCFYMLQGLPLSVGPSFEPMGTSSNSQGYLSFYDCRPATNMSADRLESMMLDFAESLRHVMR